MVGERRKQDLFLDAIEHSFSMANVAYNRLLKYCHEEQKVNDPNNDDAMVLDAWSFIDIVKRLRSVLEHTPGLKKGTAVTLFLNSTDPIPDFRHHVQHMEEKIHAVAETNRPIWGSFSWASVNLDTGEVRIAVYIPGRLAKAKGIPLVNPVGRDFHGEIDHFEMTVGDTTISVSEMFRKIELFNKKFELALEQAVSKEVAGETIRIIDLDAVTSTSGAASNLKGAGSH